MSNAGQAAFTIVGTVVGAYFGQPQLGYALGSLAGQAFFPTKAKIPGLGDNKVTSSTEGAPIALLFGTKRIPGQLGWNGGVTRNRTGGKGGLSGGAGGGYADTGDFLYYLCEGPIAGFTRVWVNGNLRYDARPGASDTQIASNGAFLSHVVTYLGDESQLPDPTLEAKEGVGNVPAFRGIAYVVLNDFDVTELGGRPPQIEFEVLSLGTEGTTVSTEQRTDALFPWTQTVDPRTCTNDHEYSYGLNDWTSDFSVAQAQAVADLGGPLGDLIGWQQAVGSDLYPFDDISPSDKQVLVLNYAASSYRLSFDTIIRPTIHFAYCAQFSAISDQISLYDAFFWNGKRDNGAGVVTQSYQPATYILISPSDTSFVAPPGYVAVQNCIDSPPYFDEPVKTGGCTVYRADTVKIRVRRKVRKPDAPCTPRCQTPYPIFPGNPEFCVIGLLPESILDYSLVSSATFDYVWLSDVFYSSGELITYPRGPVLLASDPDNTEAFWTAAYASAYAAGTMPAGMTYQADRTNPDGLHYPILKKYDWERSPSNTTLTPDDLTVGDIVRALWRRIPGALDAQLNTTQLAKLIHGYAIGRIASTRDCIEPLRSYAFFELPEVNGQLVAELRGQDSILTLTEDDLGARDDGSEHTPLVSVTRTQAAEIPYLIRVHYNNADKDYLDDVANSPRITDSATAILDLEIAISMSATEAAQVADIAIQEAYANREQYAFNLPARADLAGIYPGKTVFLPVNGNSRRARIVSKDYQAPGLLTLQAVRDDDGTYVSYAVAPDSTGATVTPLPGPTYLTVLDLPSLRTTDNDAGVYVSAYWPLGGNGTVIYESKDAGASYTARVAIAEQASQGTIRAALPTGSDTVIDNVTTLAVDLVSGTLTSVDESALPGGANTFALGAAGRWTIIQARDCVLQMDGSYLLGGLLQGLRGTLANRGTSVAGDVIVQLDSRIRRVTESVDEIGQTRLLRGVTFGTALTDAQDVSFVVSGLSYTETATPASVAAALADYLPLTNIDTDTALTANSDARVASQKATKAYVDNKIDTDGALTANSDTKVPSQKAVRTYVSDRLSGLSWKTPAARAATIAALPANTYSNGSSGVGSTLTGNSNGALTAQDGVTLVAGETLLVKDEATASKKGLYTVTQVGDASHPYILTRRTDADSSAELVNATIYVSEGSTLADTQWTCTANATITVGTTALNWAQVGTGSYDLAADIHGATSKATPVDADELALADSAASYGKKKLTWVNLKATLKTYFDTLYVSVTGAVTSVAGRTGAVTLAAADISGLASSATTNTTNASNIASGTLGDGRLSSNVPLKNANNAFTGVQAVTPYRANISGAVSIDIGATAKSNNLHLTLTGNVTSFALTNVPDGAVLNIRLIQDATGNRTWVPPVAFHFASGTSTTLSTAATAWDLISAEYGATEGTYAAAFSKGLG